MLQIHDTVKFSWGMILLLLSAVLFLFGDPVAWAVGVAGAHYLLGLVLLVAGTWLVEKATDGSWRRG